MPRKVKKTRIVLFGPQGSHIDQLAEALRNESSLEKYKIDVVGIERIKVMSPEEREKCVIIYVRVPSFLRKDRLSRVSTPNGDDIVSKDTIKYANAEQVADLTVRNFVVSVSVDTVVEYLKKR